MEKEELTYEEKEAIRKQRQAESRNRRRTRLINAGLCVYCGRVPHLPGIQSCRACNEKMKGYQRNKHYKYSSARSLKRYYKLKEQGLCTYCGKAPADNGCVTCASCRAILAERARDRIRKHRESKDADTFKTIPGICRQCGADQVVFQDKSVGWWLCKDCYIKRKRAIEAAKKSIRMMR